MKLIAALIFSLLLVAATHLSANVPPQGDKPWPDAIRARLEEDPRFFTYEAALEPLVRTLQANRVSATNAGQLASTLLPIAVKGQRSIPVLPVKFSDSATNPIDPAKLQQELFGSWPTGTMTDFYKEMSYGLFSVTGTVTSWTKLKGKAAYYQGPDPSPNKYCHGVCPAAQLPLLIREALDANNTIDWAQYDNDGPDNKPNSGDDNGIVDFVAFVHPEIGGECNVPQNRSIWSHRSSLARWGAPSYRTKAARHGGAGQIVISDYVIMPSLACDSKTMIQIGVFAHEFGHAFGLPDLYDTSHRFQGAGNWCLMSTGSWGGDGESPERPAHMSAWAKSMLGWLSPVLVTKDVIKQALSPIATNASAYKIPISTEEYYLVENRQRIKNDSKLPGSGLLIWKINDRTIDARESTNTINADVNNKGVALIEAGGRELDLAVNKGGNRGDGNDPFPGTTRVVNFDKSTTPKASKHALCDIAEVNQTVTITVRFNSDSCSPIHLTSPPAAVKSARGGETQKPASPTPASTALFEAITANPGTYLGRTVTLEGAVQNIGKNYFGDLRLVLRDANGRELPVGRTPLPIEVIPGRLESTDSPATLSSVLGKPAVVIGVIRRDPNDPNRFVLDITDVKVKE